MGLELGRTDEATDKKEGISSPFCFGRLVLQWPVVAVLLFVLSFALYALGLPGGFEFDDGSNIVDNKKLAITSLAPHDLLNAAFSSPAGPLSRPIAMVSFAINHYFSGLNPVSFKTVNIVIHGLNAILVLWLSYAVFARLLVSSRQVMLVAAASATLWALAPINLTSVLYIVQRMTSLGALFALLSLLAWMSGRTCLERSQIGPALLCWIASALMAAMAVFTKETYILLFPCILLLEWCLFQRTSLMERWLAWTLGGILGVLVVACIAWLLLRPEWVLGPYDYRPFTLQERVLTQFRVLWFYLAQILVPSNIRLGLYHDDFAVSVSLLQPGTLVAAIALAGLTLISLRYRVSAWLGMGILWFLVWHLVESTVIGLELVHEHRNYLASLGIIWVLAFAALQLSTRKLLTPPVLTGLFICLALFWASILGLRALEWRDVTTHAVAEVMHHPKSVRAKYQLGRVHILRYFESKDVAHLEKAETAYREAVAMSDYDLLPLFGLVRVLLLQDKPYAEELELLDAKLARDKLPAATNTALDNYLTCLQGGECAGLRSKFPVLVRNAIANPSVKGRSRSQLINILASYYYEIERDPLLTESVMKEGMRTMPLDFDINKNLLYFYLANGDLQQGMQVYRYIKESAIKFPVDGHQQIELACRRIKVTHPDFEC